MLVIYSKDACPKCIQLENLLKSREYKYTMLKLDKDYTRENLSDKFASLNLNQPREFPILFKGDTLIGGLVDAKVAMIEKRL